MSDLIYPDESYAIIGACYACEKLTDEHVAQVLNYLSATGYKLGLLVNFGQYPRLEYRRIANTRNNSRSFA